MPAYCTSDAREFGNKQGPFLPPSFKRKKEWTNNNKCNMEKQRRSALGNIWLSVKLWFKWGRRDLITETCTEQRSCGWEQQAPSGSFCDGTVCPHSWGDPCILGAIWLYGHEGTGIKYPPMKGYLKAIEAGIDTDRHWGTITHRGLVSTRRKRFNWIHVLSCATLISICFPWDGRTVTPVPVKSRGRELSEVRHRDRTWREIVRTPCTSLSCAFLKWGMRLWLGPFLNI